MGGVVLVLRFHNAQFAALLWKNLQRQTIQTTNLSPVHYFYYYGWFENKRSKYHFGDEVDVRSASNSIFAFCWVGMIEKRRGIKVKKTAHRQTNQH